MTLPALSVGRLHGVHPALVQVIELAYERMTPPLSFRVTEGVRSHGRQGELVAAGASRTMNSRHLTGHAVDLAAELNGQVRWDWPLYAQIAATVKAAAAELGVAIIWGGDWPRFRDGPHFELDKRIYQ